MFPYTVRRINEHVWEIAEAYHAPVAMPLLLIVGEERAAIIDTGNGIGDLLGTIREITDKPVCVCNTHGHIDHVGNNNQFDQVYMGAQETPDVYNWAPRQGRINFALSKCADYPELQYMAEYIREHTNEYDPDYEKTWIRTGDIIDLGGVALEVYEIPGHTAGCVAYVDRVDKMAFCGDSINVRIGISQPKGGPTFEGFTKALKKMLDETEEITMYWCGHVIDPFTRQQALNLLHCAEGILSGEIVGETPPPMPPRDLPDGYVPVYMEPRVAAYEDGVISYNADNIR